MTDKPLSPRKVDAAFKLEVVRMVLDKNMSVSQTSQAMQIGDTAIRRWVRQHKQAHESTATDGLGADVVMLCVREAIREPLANGSIIQLPLAYSSEAELACNIIHHARRDLSPAALKVVSLVEGLLHAGPGA